MRVLVTGTSGRVGAQVAREFLAHGYLVRGLDKAAPPGDLKGKIETVYADLTDRLALLKAAENCDGIAHLAAIPNPSRISDETIFQTNVTGTQYVLAAAEAHGIERVALASTCCTFGIYFAHHPFDPAYLPLDEKHPTLPQDLYALSKVLNEETARAYTRRAGIATVCLRLTSVMDFDNARHRHWWKRGLASDRDKPGDLWTYIEIRDAARAFRLALENAPLNKSHTLLVAARDSFSAHNVRHLAQKHFPALAPAVQDFAPFASLYDTTAAQNAIGFTAKHSWRDLPELQNITPVFD